MAVETEETIRADRPLVKPLTGKTRSKRPLVYRDNEARNGRVTVPGFMLVCSLILAYNLSDQLHDVFVGDVANLVFIVDGEQRHVGIASHQDG